MKLPSILLLAILIFNLLIPLHVNAFTFTRSLNIGSSGADVLELQKILNQDPATRIANSGVGSPGNETTYFGTLTKNAVIKFQNKYRSEILTPVGLNYGTGYFGPSTISKINGVKKTNITPTTSSVATKYPKITSISPRRIKSGEYMTIKGEGFENLGEVAIIDNYFGANMYKDLRMSNNGKELSFRVDSLIPYFVLGVIDDLDGVPVDEFFEEGNPVNDVYIKVVNSVGMSENFKYELIIDKL